MCSEFGTVVKNMPHDPQVMGSLGADVFLSLSFPFLSKYSVLTGGGYLCVRLS